MKQVTLNFVGDISLNGHYDALLHEKGAIFPFADVKKELLSADLTVGNLESPLVSKDVAPAFKMKTPLRADPAYAEALSFAGFNLMNLSNNHILDYGEEGVVATQRALRDKGINFFGYGQDTTEATQVEEVLVNGVKFAFLGYTDLIIDSPFYADANKPGIAKFEINAALDKIKSIKDNVDILIVNLHWGIEYFHLPSPAQRSQAKLLIDAGADIIIGHHPHTLQGIERYRDGLIAYSLGNFVFADIKWEWEAHNEKRVTYYKFSKQHRKSIILRVTIGENAKITGYDFIGSFLLKSGQVESKNVGSEKSIAHLSALLERKDYAIFFEKQLLLFNRKAVFVRMLNRLKKIYKIRPKHFKELRSIVCAGKK